MQKLILHYLKGLLAPFCSSSKKYQIPFCNLQKGIRYRMQNQKNPRKSKSIACGSRISFLQLAKGSLIPFRAVAKGNQIPFRANCKRNLRIACNADNVRNIPLEELKI
jgi:hypothetical protein